MRALVVLCGNVSSKKGVVGMTIFPISEDMLNQYSGKLVALDLQTNEVLGFADNLSDLEREMLKKRGISHEDWYPWGVPDWPMLRDDLASRN